MATYRIGIGTEFKLDGGVGVGTDTVSGGLGDLKVEGSIKTTDLDVTGVSTFTRYAGFVADDLNINRDTSLTGEHSTLGDIVVGLNSTFTVSTGATVTVGTVESVSIGTHFSPPTGGVEDRPEAPVEGTVRFNTDLNTLEFYNGVEWRQFTVNGTSGRGFVAGGGNPIWAGGTQIYYVHIPTLGTNTFFGELTQGRGEGTSVSNSIRGICCGGYRHGQSPNYSNVIDYVTMASSGNATDFGDAIAEKASQDSGCSSSTRGLFMGGNYHPGTNDEQIEYIEIMTTGNALDFGDLVDDTFGGGGVSNGIRGIVAGGNGPTFAAASPAGSMIQYVNIASTGNAVNFGNLTYARQTIATGCSSTRGIFAGGYNPTNGNGKRIDYITMASDGNAVFFGDLVGQLAGSYMAGTSTQTRMIFAGNIAAPMATHIQYVEIASTGESMDFGECLNGTNNFSVMMFSDSHGGLGGY